MKYLKLGESALSFSDPTTRVNLVNQDQVVEVNNTQAQSKKIKSAIKGGHLQLVTENDFDKWVELKEKRASNSKKPVQTYRELKLIDENKMIKKQRHNIW